MSRTFVLSGNTDGLLIKLAPGDEERVLGVIREWEEATGFSMEANKLVKYRRQNVNSYLALGADGNVKSKGALNFSPGVDGNPDELIVPKAVAMWMKDGTPVRETIEAAAAEKDLFSFATVITTNGPGFVVGDRRFGNVIRAYRSNAADVPAIISLGHGKVGNQHKAAGYRVFDLLSEWPSDLAVEYYVAEAEKILAETSVEIDNSRNVVARQLEGVGFETRGIGGSAGIKTGGNYSGSRQVGVVVAPRFSTVAVSPGTMGPESLLLRVTKGEDVVAEIHDISGKSAKELRGLKAAAGTVTNGTVPVEGEGLDYSVTGLVEGRASIAAEVPKVEVEVEVEVEAEAPAAIEAQRIDVGNEEILRVLFGDAADEAYVVATPVPPDTDDPVAKKSMWSGGPAKYARGRHLLPDTNNYAAISTFTPDAEGVYRRTTEAFRCLYLVMLDDIGTKAKEPGSAGFGVPTARIETSPNNFQMLYRLTVPLEDRAAAETLVAAITRNSGTVVTDKGAGGVNRVFRLPVGVNNKTKYGEPFSVRLCEWNPEVSYTAEVIASWVNAGDIHSGGATRIRKGAPAEKAMTHPVIVAFEGMGKLLAGSPGRSGWVPVECPWCSDHTGRADDGAAVLITESGSWSFRCHHGHCSGEQVVVVRGVERVVPTRGARQVHEWLMERGVIVPRPSEAIWGSSVLRAAGANAVAAAGSGEESVIDLSMFNRTQTTSKSDEGGGGDPTDRDGTSQARRLVLTEKGKPVACASTINHFLHYDNRWAGVLGRDLFTDRRMLMAPLPNLDGRVPNDFSPRPILDDDIVSATIWFEANLQIKIGKGVVGDALLGRAAECSFDPLADWLRGLVWDGKPRLRTWLQTYCGAEVAEGQPAEYLAAVGSKWMISAVARAMQPGCKVDTMLVFVGEQGRGKSTMARELCFDPSAFSDSIPHQLESKDASDHVRGRWIIEFSEMAAMTRGEVEGVKAFLSRQVEEFRPAYGREKISYPRRCVFFGSTNTTEFLKDDTGNRRFWPVKIDHDIDIAAVRTDRDQLWAEAVVRFDQGAQWHLTRDESALAEEKQAIHLFTDDRVDILRDKLVGKTTVRASEACHMILVNNDRKNQMLVTGFLKELGWEKESTRTGKVWHAPKTKI